MDRSVRGLDGAPEWPAMRALLPDLRDKRILDLGCGFGWFARWAMAQGAASVLGVDLSENMLARARAETADPAVRYVQADLETLDLPGKLSTSPTARSPSIMCEDFGRLVGAVSRALVSGGHFVFSDRASDLYGLDAARMADDRRWTDGSGRSIIMRIEGARTTDWLAKGVRKQHRTLATTLNALIDAGFAIRRVVEWSPTPEEVAARPSLADEARRPMMALVAAQK